VLIVDDDDEARAAAAEALRSAGLVVDEVSNGLEALKAFQTRRPHIVREVMTPFVDGYSTCRAMRDQAGGEEASIVMMTDIDDVESLRFGYEAGATDFITKPVNPVILQHRIRYMLRAAEVTDQLRRSERQIAVAAEHDALTGLPNRRSLDHYMRRLCEERPNVSLGAVFLVDLDGFKRVNDTFGHSAGDELICEVGRRMTECFQLERRSPSDARRPLSPLLVRFGGDEFIFIEPSVETREEAMHVADRMLAAIGGSFEIRGHQLSVTASIGIALLSDVGTDIERLIQSADTAMYDAKAHDRNNARFYSHELSDAARAHLDIENALRQPHALDQLELFYQPKVDLRTSRVVGAEALLRWRHPERGLVSPAEFVPVAEDTGLIVPIGRWVVREACRRVKAWNDVPALRGMRIAVNVSARQFRDPRFLQDVQQILDETGIDPRAIEIEITEGTLMNDTKAARAILNELKKLGIWIALDDFGTGYSSLGYLRQFPFDTLKVDRSFVSDILVDDGSAAITSAIIAMANRLGLNVVAEGVETEGQLEYLRTLGCDQIQGYFYSRPLPVLEFERWAVGKVKTDSLRAPRQFASGQRLSVIPGLRAIR
jgi:diguanylate cyclase (GGDEF)-like protein